MPSIQGSADNFKRWWSSRLTLSGMLPENLRPDKPPPGALMEYWRRFQVMPVWSVEQNAPVPAGHFHHDF